MGVTFQEVALIAVLLAAIILSHALVPTAAATVVSMVTTLTGYFFASRIQAKKSQASNALGEAAPVLKLVPKSDEEKGSE